MNLELFNFESRDLEKYGVRHFCLTPYRQIIIPWTYPLIKKDDQITFVFSRNSDLIQNHLTIIDSLETEFKDNFTALLYTNKINMNNYFNIHSVI